MPIIYETFEASKTKKNTLKGQKIGEKIEAHRLGNRLAGKESKLINKKMRTKCTKYSEKKNLK